MILSIVSLTPRPNGDRREEVYAACELLQSLGLRSFSPSVTACPGCGRTTSSTFQELAERVQDYIREQMPVWKTRYEGVETMTLAVISGRFKIAEIFLGEATDATAELTATLLLIGSTFFIAYSGRSKSKIRITRSSSVLFHTSCSNVSSRLTGQTRSPVPSTVHRWSPC